MKYTKTPVANLYRADSGTYFMHAKIKGRLVRCTLKTKSFTIAKIKLREAHADESAKVEKDGGLETVESLIAEYIERDKNNPELRPSTKVLHGYVIKAVEKTWPKFAGMDAGDVTKTECEAWARRYRSMRAPSRYNNTIDALRAVLAIGVERGLLSSNPAKDIPKAGVKQKHVQLPSIDQFARFLEYMDGFSGMKRKDGRIAKSKKATGDLVRFLAYTGMRIAEACAVTPDMIDFDKRLITLPPSVTKNGKSRPVPIIQDLLTLLAGLVNEYKAISRTGPLMAVRDIRRGMETACKAVGMHRITHHDLRHLFITRCIESGVDVKTIAEWVGHSDGGALILKTYAHLRNEHSQAMAAKVSFAAPMPDGVIKLEVGK